MSADWSLAFGGLMAIIVGCNVSSRQFRAEGELHSTMIPGRTYIAQTPERPVTLRAAAEPRILCGMGRAMLAVLALGGLGCVDAGRFPQLAREDQNLFHRCWPSMENAICGRDKDGMYITMCIRGAEKQYADKPGSKRGKWLVARGCPKDMVAESQEENES